MVTERLMMRFCVNLLSYENVRGTRSGSVLTGLIPPVATNSSFSKSTGRSKSRSRPLGQKYCYQQKGLVTENRYV